MVYISSWSPLIIAKYPNRYVVKNLNFLSFSSSHCGISHQLWHSLAAVRVSVLGKLNGLYLLPWEVLFLIKFVSFHVSSSSSSSSLSLQPLLKAIPCCKTEWGQICTGSSRRTPFHERRYQVVAVSKLWSTGRGGTFFRAKIAVTAVSRAVHVPANQWFSDHRARTFIVLLFRKSC